MTESSIFFDEDEGIMARQHRVYSRVVLTQMLMSCQR